MNECEKSVDFWVEELTKDTDPEHFGLNVNDFYYTAYKHNYSTWMWNRGYNAGLVNLQTKVNTYCVPQWISVKDRLPEPNTRVFVYAKQGSYMNLRTDYICNGRWFFQ